MSKYSCANPWHLDSYVITQLHTVISTDNLSVEHFGDIVALEGRKRSVLCGTIGVVGLFRRILEGSTRYGLMLLPLPDPEDGGTTVLRNVVFTSRDGVTFQKSWISSNAAVRTSNVCFSNTRRFAKPGISMCWPVLTPCVAAFVHTVWESLGFFGLGGSKHGGH